MEKLELKQLAPYLPYGLSGVDYFQGYKLIRYINFNNVMAIVDGDTKLKPLLRPLSDLTKDIEHNGERFVPIEWFEKNINKTIILYNPIDEDLDLRIDIDTEDYSQTIDLFEGYKSVQKLLSWHFDVFGLIDKGLAIDINTIK